MISDISLTNYDIILKKITSTDLNNLNKSSMLIWMTVISLFLFNTKKSREFIR